MDCDLKDDSEYNHLQDIVVQLRQAVADAKDVSSKIGSKTTLKVVVGNGSNSQGTLAQQDKVVDASGSFGLEFSSSSSISRHSNGHKSNNGVHEDVDFTLNSNEDGKHNLQKNRKSHETKTSVASPHQVSKQSRAESEKEDKSCSPPAINPKSQALAALMDRSGPVHDRLIHSQLARQKKVDELAAVLSQREWETFTGAPQVDRRSEAMLRRRTRAGELPEDTVTRLADYEVKKREERRRKQADERQAQMRQEVVTVSFLSPASRRIAKRAAERRKNAEAAAAGPSPSSDTCAPAAGGGAADTDAVEAVADGAARCSLSDPAAGAEPPLDPDLCTVVADEATPMAPPAINRELAPALFMDDLGDPVAAQSRCGPWHEARRMPELETQCRPPAQPAQNRLGHGARSGAVHAASTGRPRAHLPAGHHDAAPAQSTRASLSVGRAAQSTSTAGKAWGSGSAAGPQAGPSRQTAGSANGEAGCGCAEEFRSELRQDSPPPRSGKSVHFDPRVGERPGNVWGRRRPGGRDTPSAASCRDRDLLTGCDPDEKVSVPFLRMLRFHHPDPQETRHWQVVLLEGEQVLLRAHNARWQQRGCGPKPPLPSCLPASNTRLPPSLRPSLSLPPSLPPSPLFSILFACIRLLSPVPFPFSACDLPPTNADMHVCPVCGRAVRIFLRRGSFCCRPTRGQPTSWYGVGATRF